MELVKKIKVARFYGPRCRFFYVFCMCVILLEPVGLDLWSVIR